jgi:hypothetical protein
MNEVLLVILTLAVAFFLVTQLSVLGSLRSLNSMLLKALQEREDRDSRKNSAQFEMQSAYEARRVKFRAKGDLTARAQYLGRSLNAQVLDVSTTGALLRFDKEQDFKVGDVFPVTISLLQSRQIEAGFRIVRLLSGTEYGGCFEDLTIQSKQFIADYVNRQAKKELEADLSDSRAT